jgi:2-polyprenyl-3-methyl-5-hydroxy-6-metoxy-1,4-benzoquinol methylase
MIHLKTCPICDDNNITAIYCGLMDRLHEQNQEAFSLQRCQNCNNIFTNPQIELTEYSKFYPTTEYIPYIPQRVKKSQILPKLIHDAIVKIFIEKTRGVINPGKKLLEVGCANGDFLLKCKKRGMDVTGVEIDKVVAKRATKKGLAVLDISFEEAYQYLKDQRFDIIFMSHVFEHFQQPKAILAYARNLLKDNGKIVLIIPNIKSITHYLFKKVSMHLDVPRHFFHYSPETIRYLAEMNGLAIEKIRFVSGPPSFLNSIRYKFHLKNIKLDKSYLLKILFLPLMIIFNSLKLGDEITVFLRKN